MKLLLVIALIGAPGCTSLREVNSDGGRGGYMILNDGTADTWVYYCQPTQDIGAANCRPVQKIE